jgi:prepilin-type N-terminal cleavage/methylation domain-containing protein
MRRGTSLPELVVVIALAGLVAALAVPSVRHAMDRRAVELAIQQVTGAHLEARLFTIRTRRPALLLLSADSMVLRSAFAGETTVVWRRPGPRSFGVGVTGNARTLRFIPTGYTIGGSNISYTVTKGNARRRVVISRLGRLRTE